MSTASGHTALIWDHPPTDDDSRRQPCNVCAFGTHIDPQQLSGKYLISYFVIHCPICGQSGLRSKPRVRRSSTTQHLPSIP